MDIDNLQAGRDLDALIAEKVMGEIQVGPDTWSPHDSETGITLDVALHLSLYSTNIAAAWQVVEKLQEKFVVYMEHDGNRWSACFTHGMMGMPEFQDVEAVAETAPLAICRAALKAITNQEP